MTATSAAASSLPPVRTSCHVPLSLMTSISEETIALWLKLGALEKLEQAVLDGYGDQLCGKTSRIPQVNKFLKQVPLFQNKIREIHLAVSQGRLRDVQHLIDRKKLAFCRDHNGASPLHKAVIFGHQDVIEYLVKRYAGSIHIRDHQGRTALHYAAFLPDGGEIYQYLLASGADERAMDVYGRQPSYYLNEQNESTLRQLRDGSTLNGLRKIKPRYYGQVSAGQPFTNVNRPTVTKSQIRELIADGNIAALEDLVLQGQGDRILGETSSIPKVQSFLNIVPMYMERIYDVHRAVMRDQLEHVVILLENKKLAMARDQLGATPLHKAVLFGHYKIAHFISHQFPDTLNAIDMEGRTALHYAAALKDNKNMYGILIEAGANKGIYDNKGKTADYYAQYPEHLNLDEVIKRCHKVNANYLANTASRIKGKSPVRQSPPPSNGNLSSPRSEDNTSSSKDASQSNDSGNENELMSLLQKDKLPKRLDMSSANIRRWVSTKDMDKLTKAVMEGYGDKVVRVNTNEESEDKEQITEKITEMVERINAIHSAVSSDDLTELENHLEEKDFALAKDHMGNTPLHKAVLLRKTKIVSYLIEKFPETINAKNKNGLTALHYAAAMSRKDGLQIYKMLLQAGADPKIRDNHGRTPDYYKTHLITLPNKGIMKSRPAGGRHSETLNRYSKQGVLERMTTALQRGDVELLQDLVLEGHGKHLLGKTSWNEDVKTFLKELPSYLNKIQSLHEATSAADLEKVKELVSSNEKLMRARDESGALPIHIATASESTDVLEHFITNYPNTLNAKDTSGKTALHIASQKGNIALCKTLKQAGADPKILDQKGKTPDFYLQNGKYDGIKNEFDSSKTPFNSNSESSHSGIKKKNSRRKSSKEVKKATLNLKDVAEAAGDEVENNANKDETSDIKQGDNGIIEENRRKDSFKEIENKDDTELENNSENISPTENNSNEINLKDDSENTDENIDNKEITTEQSDSNEINSDEKETENQTDGSEIPAKIDDEEETNVKEEEDQLQNKAESEDYQEENVIKENNEIERTDSEEHVENHIAEEKQDDINDEPTGDNAEKETNENPSSNDNEGINEEDKNDNEGMEDVAEENKEQTPVNEEGSEENKETLNGLETDNNPNEASEESIENNEGENEKTESVEEQESESKESEIANKSTDEISENINNEDNTKEMREGENNSESITVADAGSRKKDSFDNVEESQIEENGLANDDKNEAKENDNTIHDIITEDNLDEEKTEDIGHEDTKELTDEKDIEEIQKEENENNNENLVTEDNDTKENEDIKNENTEGKNVNEDVQTENIANDNESIEQNENHQLAKEPDKTDQNEDIEETENVEIAKDKTDNIINPHNNKMNSRDEHFHHTKDHLDELIEHWIKEGDLLRLEHVVLAGQGDRLIERTSEDKQVQDFLDLVPIYMAKIRAVHEAVAKGQLREVRSVLTRKRFALSRDHVGASPLHLAVLHGHTDVSTYIISHFPETMDGPDNEGRTPLHYATALPDNGALYRLLKMAGADENIEDKAGHSPKYYMSNPGQLTLETLMDPYSSAE